MATPNIVPRADSEGGLGTSSKYWASAYIDAVYVGAGKVGRDADNNIDFSIDDRLQFKIVGSVKLQLTASGFLPNSNDLLPLGVAGYGFSDLFLASGAVINFDSGNVTLTHSSNRLTLADDDQLSFGNGNDFNFSWNGTNGHIKNETSDTGSHIYISNYSNDGDIVLRSDDGSGGLAEYLTLDGGLGFTTAQKSIRMSDSVELELGTDGDADIYHTGGQRYDRNHTGDWYLINYANDSDIIFQSDDGSGGVTEYFRLDGSAASGGTVYTVWPDNSRIAVGTDKDFNIKHDGSSTALENSTGSLYIQNQADDQDIIFTCDNGAGGSTTYFYLDGSSATHDGSATTNLFTNWPDKSTISLGTSHDFKIQHNGTNTELTNSEGNLTFIQHKDDGDIIFQCDDGSSGIETYLMLDGSLSATIVPDSKSLGFGTGGDLYITHDATNSHITNFTGDLYITNKADDKDVIFRSDDGSGDITEYFRLDGGLSAPFTVFPDNSTMVFGNSFDLRLFHDSSNSYISQEGTGELVIRNLTDDGDISFQSDDGSGGTAEYFRVDGGNSQIRVYKELNITDSISATFGNSGDLSIQHDSNNSYITANGTGDLYIKQMTADKDITFQCDDGSGGETEYFRIDGGFSSPQTIFPDNSQLNFGDSLDLRIVHDGSNSYINQNGTGDLIIQNNTDDKDIILRSDDGSGGTTAYLTLDGSAGRTVVSKQMRFEDTVDLAFGGGTDLRIYHDPNNSYIVNNTGNLTITNNADDADIIFQSDDGSGGITTYFILDGSIARTSFFKHTIHNDNVHASFGDYPDLNIYHDGSNSYILHNGDTGNLVIQNSLDDTDIILKCDNGSGGTTAYITLDGSDVSTIVSTIKVMMPNLPTSDPSTAGQLWNDSGTLKISAG